MSFIGEKRTGETAGLCQSSTSMHRQLSTVVFPPPALTRHLLLRFSSPNNPDRALVACAQAQFNVATTGVNEE